MCRYCRRGEIARRWREGLDAIESELPPRPVQLSILPPPADENEEVTSRDQPDLEARSARRRRRRPAADTADPGPARPGPGPAAAMRAGPGLPAVPCAA